MLLAEVIGDVAGDDGDVNGGVELLELRGARLSAVLADVALREIEVRAKIGELDRGGVLQGDSPDARQDDVLGCETERGGVTGASATTRSGRGGRGFGRVGAGFRVADRQIWFGKPTGRNGRVRVGLRSGGQDGNGGGGVARTDLGAQTLEAADEDGGARETLHGLAAVHRELARVQVLIDLARRGHCVVLVRALLLGARVVS